MAMNYSIDFEIKIWQEYLPSVIYGRKTFEVRLDDRNYTSGQVIKMNGYDKKKNELTGYFVVIKVKDVLKDAVHFGIMPGFCVFSIEVLDYRYDELSFHLHGE